MGKFKYYLTFGTGPNQHYQMGHVVVYAKNYQEARKTAFEHYGCRWSFLYTRDNWLTDEHHGFNEFCHGTIGKEEIK